MGPELLPNFTFFIELGLFFISYFMLKFFVFRPYLKLHKMRQDKTVGLKEQAIRDREKALKLESDYDIFLKTERKKVALWVDEERKKIVEEERSLIGTAQELANSEKKKLHDALSHEVEVARKELLPHTYEYSSHIASKLVGKTVKVSAGATAEQSKSSSAEPTVTG